MVVWVLLLWLFHLSLLQGLILPLTKPNGDVDMSSLLSHVTLMEQTVKSVQTQLQTNTNELTILQTKLQTTEAELKIVQADEKTTSTKLAAAESQLASTQAELTKVKDDLKSAEIEIAILKKNNTTSVPAEFKTLQSDVKALKLEQQQLKSKLNYTVIDIIGSDVKLFSADLASVKSDIATMNLYINKTGLHLQFLESQFYGAGLNTSDLWNSSVGPHGSRDLVDLLLNVTGELISMKSDISTSLASIGNVQHQVASLNSKLMSTRNELTLAETELANLQEVITNGTLSPNDTSLRNISDLLGAGIAFQMSLSNGQNNWKTLIFDTVVYNPSSAYNETSGIFTAPASGNYLFWANLHVDFNNYGSTNKYVYLNSGSKTLGKGFARTSTDNKYGVISFTTVVNLQDGDDVYFSTDSITNVIEGDGVSSYGGALIHVTL